MDALGKFIDGHHVSKHKQERCRTALHPSKEALKWTRKLNTEAAEHLWSRVNRHKFKLRTMTDPLFHFLLLCILHERNRGLSNAQEPLACMSEASSAGSSSSDESESLRTEYA